MRLRIGALASSAVLIILAQILKFPEPFIFSFFILSFSPIWINIIKFFLALLKGNPHVALPTITTYLIAFGYYFYKYGISSQSIIFLLGGLSASLIPITLYDLTFNYLNNEGIKSYRIKAFLSFSTATTIGTLFIIGTKTILLFS